MWDYAKIPQNFHSDILGFEWVKEGQIRLCNKLKALSTVWKVLKELFDVLNFEVWTSFPYKKTGTATESYNDSNELTRKSLISQYIFIKFHASSLRNFKSIKQLFLDQFWMTASNLWAWIDNYT